MSINMFDMFLDEKECIDNEEYDCGGGKVFNMFDVFLSDKKVVKEKEDVKKLRLEDKMKDKPQDSKENKPKVVRITIRPTMLKNSSAKVGNSVNPSRKEDNIKSSYCSYGNCSSNICECE